MNFDQWPIVASFLAGVITFVSPCILPLIPAYLSFITGSSLDKLKSGVNPIKSTFLSALFFVLGFSLIFTLLGASATHLGVLLDENRELLRWIGGTIVIIFGLHLAGVARIKFLYREKKLPMKKMSLGYLGSFLIGLAFAVGWTPCLGPILSSILILASTQETVFQGMMLLAIYSLGMGIPLLITALFINGALRLLPRIKRFYKGIEITSGVILIVLGILLLTDNLGIITVYLTRFAG
jgi:cytochrome c-type biogenesis protein